MNKTLATVVNNIVGGNIGQKFDLGVQLSDTGSSGGLLTSTMFPVKATERV